MVVVGINTHTHAYTHTGGLMVHILVVLGRICSVSQDSKASGAPPPTPAPGRPYLCQVHQGVGLIVEFPLLHLHAAQSGGSREGGVRKRRRSMCR